VAWCLKSVIVRAENTKAHIRWRIIIIIQKKKKKKEEEEEEEEEEEGTLESIDWML
jgi:hypothetical protein